MSLPKKPGIPSQRPQGIPKRPAPQNPQNRTGAPQNNNGNPNAPVGNPVNPNANPGRVRPSAPQNPSQTPRQKTEEQYRRGVAAERQNPAVEAARMREKLNERKNNVQNPFDNEDDDTFTPLTVQEQLSMEEEDEEQERRNAKRRAAERRAAKAEAQLREKRRQETAAKFENVLEEDDEEENIEIEFDDTEDLADGYDFNNVEESSNDSNSRKSRKLDDVENDANDEPETEAIEQYDDEEEESPQKPSRRDRKNAKRKKNSKSIVEDNDVDEYGQPVFVDEDSLKLKPFGGNKGGKLKRKTKEYEYEDRKNRRGKAQAVQFVVVGLLALLVLSSLKNALVPPAVQSDEDIVSLVQQTTNLTNFPLERGEGFAKDFTQAYLSTDTGDSTTNQSILSYFYSGAISTDEAEDNSNRSIADGYSQKVIYGPTVYEAVGLTDYSARYTIGAVVQPKTSASTSSDDTSSTDAAADGTDTDSTPQDPNAPRWIFLNVNVYYDAKTDKFTITPDSPSVVPNSQVATSGDLPDQQSLGEEITDSDVLDQIQPVVYGFLTGYRESSPTNHSTLDQYIINNPPATLTQGLNNEYHFLNGNVEDAVTYNAYQDDTDPNVIKVQAEVSWTTNDSTDNSMELTSTYVLTLQKQSDKYVVAKFKPLYFAKDPEADSDTAE